MSNITQFFPSGSSGGGGGTGDFSRFEFLNPLFENRIIITSSTTFVVPTGTKAIKFTAVGGGQAGVGTTGGPGGGYFEKTYQEPFTGVTTSFQLTIGAAGGNTVLANSAGTTIATAYGATAIGTGVSVGVGGTASGGDVNYDGSPGGISPGVGGASGGKFGSGVYNSTYAGRWVYFQESFLNDNLKNLILANLAINGGITTSGSAYQTALGGQAGNFGSEGSSGKVGGVGANGGPGAPPLAPGGAGGFGGNGGVSGGPGGFGGSGGPGYENLNSNPYAPGGFNAGPGGPGGFGGGGGIGGPSGSGIAGLGGPGGFGGGGGRGGFQSPGVPSAPGQGGPGAILVEWTTTALPT